MILLRLRFVLIIFTLITILGCNHESSTDNEFELNVRGNNIYTFDYQTINKELEKLTTDCLDDCFVILALADEKYIQTMYDPNFKKFHLEYRDGDGSRHFEEVTTLLTLAEIQRTFNNYYNKQDNWDNGIRWEKLEM